VSHTTPFNNEHTRKISRPDAQQPRDWRIDDLKSIAGRLGIDWRNDGGSHYVFSFPGIDEDVCVPAHRPIKPVYARQFMALCDKVKELQ